MGIDFGMAGGHSRLPGYIGDKVYVVQLAVPEGQECLDHYQHCSACDIPCPEQDLNPDWVVIANNFPVVFCLLFYN